MDTPTIEEIKELLLTEKKRLREELSHFAHRKPKQKAGDEFESDFPNMGDKEDENASEVAQYSDNLSLEEELEKALRDVRAALKRIEEGTYGVCKYCQQKIKPGRLKARPTSSSCIKCKKTFTQEV